MFNLHISITYMCSGSAVKKKTKQKNCTIKRKKTGIFFHQVLKSLIFFHNKDYIFFFEQRVSPSVTNTKYGLNKIR